jgi:hypothetical protein
MPIPERVTQSDPLPSAGLLTLLKKVFSFPVMMGILLVGGMYVPLRTFWIDPDVWWHIRVGATILSAHHWPTTDPYSFTAYGTHWIAYQWLGEILLAVVERIWGLRGLLAFDVVMAGAILVALYTLATIRCRNSKAAFVTCALFMPLVYNSCSLRPQMLAYLFLVLTLIILERFRQGHTAALWWLPPLFLVWVNTHGSFVLGVFALGVYWACGLVEIHWGELESRVWTSGERVRLELVAALSLIALTLTPYGAELLLYPFDVASSQDIMVANIVEWQPMMFEKFFGKLFLVLVLAFLVAQVTLRLRWRLEELVLLLVGIYASCLHMRFVLAFVPFSAPMIAVILSRWTESYDPAKDKHALNALFMAGTAAAVFWSFPTRANLQNIVEKELPVKAVAYLRQHPVPKPMFNDYRFGGFLIWQLSDVNKVFIDGRADIYERTGVFADYLKIARVNFPAPYLLDAYNVQSCLLGRSETLATVLDASPGWQKIYGDQVSVLYVRRPRAAGENAVTSAK